MEQAVLEQKVRCDVGFDRRAVGEQLAALKHRAHVRDTRRVDIRERFARIDLRQQSLQQCAAAAFASNRTDLYIGINFIESLYERVNVSLVPSSIDSEITGNCSRGVVLCRIGGSCHYCRLTSKGCSKQAQTAER